MPVHSEQRPCPHCWQQNTSSVPRWMALCRDSAASVPKRLLQMAQAVAAQVESKSNIEAKWKAVYQILVQALSLMRSMWV